MATNRSPLKAAGGPSFETVNIKAQPAKTVEPTNVVTSTADWTAGADAIASIGQSIAGGMKDVSASKSNLEEAGKQLEDGKKPAPKKSRLERRVDKAKASGKDAKAARLTGKLERKNTEQKNKTSRIEAVNRDKKKALTKSEFFKGQKFNEKQKKKGGAESTSHLFKPLSPLKPKGVSIDPTISTITAPVLQKLGSTGKGFKLRAFKNN